MEFIQAKYYTKTNGRTITQIVIHDMEAPEKGDTAERVARYFATTTVVASAHYNVDNNSVVQSVLDKDIAYHAGKSVVNARSIGIEHAGYASQSMAEWLDPYGLDMMNQSAQLVSNLCKLYSIPPRWLSLDEVRNNVRGICTHADVTYAYNVYGGHTDPGRNFPKDHYIGLVEAYSGGQEEQEEDMKAVMMSDRWGAIWLVFGNIKSHVPNLNVLALYRYLGVPIVEGDNTEWLRGLGTLENGIPGKIPPTFEV